MDQQSILITRAQLVALLAYLGPAQSVVVSKRDGFVHARRVDETDWVNIPLSPTNVAAFIKQQGEAHAEEEAHP